MLASLLARLSALNARLSRAAMYAACACLAALLAIVVYGVVMRYVFNNAPAFVEQVALLLVVSVAMFAASAGVRDATHIGMDSLVAVLPPWLANACRAAVQVFTILFALALVFGGGEMAVSMHSDTIPTLGIPESVRYVPIVIAGILMTSFAFERILALRAGTPVERSWH